MKFFKLALGVFLLTFVGCSGSDAPAGPERSLRTGSTFSVYISGPSNLTEKTTYYWNAVVSNAPYNNNLTYEWYRVVDGTPLGPYSGATQNWTAYAGDYEFDWVVTVEDHCPQGQLCPGVELTATDTLHVKACIQVSGCQLQ